MTSKKDKSKPDLEQRKLDIGMRFSEIREEAFDKMSQQKFGELVDYMEASNPQGRIAILEKGKGSAKVIYSVLIYLYEQGININYLFGEEPIYRTTQRTDLYSENVTDYVKEVKLMAGEAREHLDEMLRSTYQMEAYLTGAVPRGEDVTSE